MAPEIEMGTFSITYGGDIVGYATSDGGSSHCDDEESTTHEWWALHEDSPAYPWPSSSNSPITLTFTHVDSATTLAGLCNYIRASGAPSTDPADYCIREHEITTVTCPSS